MSTSDRGLRLLEALRARGIKPRGVDGGLRYAAHEACHALQLELWDDEPWTTNAIHNAYQQLGPSDMLRHEAEARVVEREVCAALGVDSGPIEHWAVISCMEMIKSGGPRVERLEDFMRCVEAVKDTSRVRELVESVLWLSHEGLDPVPEE